MKQEHHCCATAPAASPPPPAAVRSRSGRLRAFSRSHSRSPGWQGRHTCSPATTFVSGRAPGTACQAWLTGNSSHCAAPIATPRLHGGPPAAPCSSGGSGPARFGRPSCTQGSCRTPRLTPSARRTGGCPGTCPGAAAAGAPSPTGARCMVLCAPCAGFGVADRAREARSACLPGSLAAAACWSGQG